MEGPDWTVINAGIQQQMQHLYNTNKLTFKVAHWKQDPETGTFDVNQTGRMCDNNTCFRAGIPLGVTHLSFPCFAPGYHNGCLAVYWSSDPTQSGFVCMRPAQS